MQSPRVYATLLLWLLSELFEKLPEVGDVDKPKLVFFFDEAHLLFDDAPPSLLAKVEQVVRLIRSKGVGVYFVTQNPTDIPDDVLGQLGNKVQHALRAYTPKDQKAVAAMAETFRPNPAVNVATAVTELNVGEALISALDATGAPMPVERAWIVPPHGHIGAPAPEQLVALRAASPVASTYATAIDRESAYEQLAARAQSAAAAAAASPTPPPPVAVGGPPPVPFVQQTGAPKPPTNAALAGAAGVAGGLLAAFGTSALRSAGSAAGREITRGLLGSMGIKMPR
jgi:DNA helicase HerA-like ATPase